MDTEKKVDFKQYLNLVSLAQVRNRIWRPGQVYFNVLSELRPDISEEIRGSKMDPFYRDERIAEFLSFVADKW